ncbi:hypothetical protein CRUP_019468 [Coryphaenoides rupestris]|nr:hypothetical protein CRUP_019468 [Coryphaenoides rupestris]
MWFLIALRHCTSEASSVVRSSEALETDTHVEPAGGAPTGLLRSGERRGRSRSRSREQIRFPEHMSLAGAGVWAQQAFLLENVPCTNASCQAVGRTFLVHWDQSELASVHQAAVATFFDIYEDGILDMLVLSQAEGKADLIVHMFKNNFEADAYFIKVIVLSGLCSSDCPQKPFGVNQPGPYVMYNTVDSNGNMKNASAGQLSQRGGGSSSGSRLAGALAGGRRGARTHATGSLPSPSAAAAAARLQDSSPP